MFYIEFGGYLFLVAIFTFNINILTDEFVNSVSSEVCCEFISVLNMEQGFVKASSDNLPRVDYEMIDSFYLTNMNFLSAEMKNVKTKRSTRGSYGDNAVGYVQLKREGNVCTVKAKLTPEHKIHKKSYTCLVRIDEEASEVLECGCLDCPASEGGCKHGVAFLMWLHRRSEEPSVTSQTCYWKKSKLSKIGKEYKFLELKDLTNREIPELRNKEGEFLNKVKALSGTGGIFSFFENKPFEDVSIHHLALNFQDKTSSVTAEEFMEFMSKKMTDSLCEKAEVETRKQSKCSTWYELRFGRVTASKAYETAKCKTLEGVLVESILGASKPLSTDPVKRGLLLEEAVRKEVEHQRGLKISKCGLYLNRKYPIFGASPDGITDSYCIEIKCTSKEKTISNFVYRNAVRKKYDVQMQLQMLFTNRTRALLCIASPDFETTKKIIFHEVIFKKEECLEIMQLAKDFWKRAIFPKVVT